MGSLKEIKRQNNYIYIYIYIYIYTGRQKRTEFMILFSYNQYKASFAYLNGQTKLPKQKENGCPSTSLPPA